MDPVSIASNIIPPEPNLLLAVMIPLFGSLIVMTMKNNPNLREFVSFCSAILLFAIVLSFIPAIQAGKTLVYPIFNLLPGLSITHPERFKLDLLNVILGEGMSSRLFTEIRDNLGLAYSIFSSADHFLDSGSGRTARSGGGGLGAGAGGPRRGGLHRLAGDRRRRVPGAAGGAR